MLVNLSRVLSLASKTVLLHQNHTVVIPLFWTLNADGQTRKLNITDLESAILDYWFEVDEAWVTVSYEINGQRAVGYPDGAKSGSIDVTSLLRQGNNEFTAIAYRRDPEPFVRSAVFDTSLTLNYVGAVPDDAIGPPQGDGDGFVLPWWWPIPVVGVGLVATYLILKRVLR